MAAVIVVQTVSNETGSDLTRTYDGLDRLTSETTPEGAISYTYDANSRRATMAVAGQPTISYGYDNADRLTTITQGSAVTTFGYDNADRRTSVTLPSGVTTRYAYDTASRLTGLTYTLNTTTLGTLLYGYDASGSRKIIGGTWARTGLPPALEAATYNAANRQVTFGTQTLTYDLNGNLTSDGTSTYTWDARDRLAAITGPTAASFVYDGAGRRRTKTINGSTTSFLHDGLNPVQEQAGAALRNLLTGLGIDEFLLRDDGAGARGLLADALGSTVALVDGSGMAEATYTYEPFGATAVTGSPGANALTYTGREDDGTALKYYRARYYHPGLQRFISEDPLEFAGGDVNLYVYVGNDPVNWIDPLGEIRWFTPRPSTGGMRGPQPRSTPMRDTPPPPFRPKPAPLPPELAPQWEQAPWWARILKAISDIADALHGNPPTPKSVLPPSLGGRKDPCRPLNMYEEVFVEASVQRTCM